MRVAYPGNAPDAVRQNTLPKIYYYYYYYCLRPLRQRGHFGADPKISIIILYWGDSVLILIFVGDDVCRRVLHQQFFFFIEDAGI